jgi:hypothetical protein
MRLSLSLSPQLSLREELLQELECTLRLSQKLEDPFEYARELFESSKKANVPIKIGKYTILVRAALVNEDQLGKLFENEHFGGVIARLEERYQFFNREIRAPAEFGALMPRLIAFHCLASIKVSDFADESGTISQYQAIALELAYARSNMREKAYQRYEAWRAAIERTDFFRRDDWKIIADHAYCRFQDLAGGIRRNASAMDFAISMQGGTFALKGDKAVSADGTEVEVHRKTIKAKLFKNSVVK